MTEQKRTYTKQKQKRNEKTWGRTEHTRREEKIHEKKRKRNEENNECGVTNTHKRNETRRNEHEQNT